ncbi:hypothetical protein ACIO93_33765 [Streptomyces sp. NPDC087903]|uniref:hypothetical protein n=1 Tax=Streptomyces sp. NPDC087903 TaxID=3365819 RepID=UPI0037F6BA49
MHVLLVPPMDTVDHPAVRHVPSAWAGQHVDPAGPEVGDEALHEETAGLFGSGLGDLCSQPLRSQLPAGAHG